MNRKPFGINWLSSLFFLFCCLFTSALYAANWYVETTGNDATGNGSAGNPWKTINYAISKAAAGDVIYIGSGQFAEQVDVPKNLTLIGKGITETKIISPVTLAQSFYLNAPVSMGFYSVVYAHDAAAVTIKKLTVDGNSNGDSFAGLVGVSYRNAGGVLDSAKVISIINTPPYTSEFGYSVFAVADNGINRSVTVSNSSFITFQKTALGFLGANLTAVVNGNTIEGAGPLESLTQNGVQISNSATGSVVNNKIKNLAVTDENFSATAILVIDARSSVLVANNELTDCQTGVYFINTNGSISQNKILFDSNNMGGLSYWYGILVRNGNASIVGNELDGDGHGTAVDGFTFAPGEKTVIYAANNSVKNFETGISVEADAENSCSGGTITGNSILNTPESIYNNQTYGPNNPACDTPDAPCNWYGTTNPEEIKDKVIGIFNYKPWLTNGTDAQPNVPGFQPVPNSCDTSNCVKLETDDSLKETFPNYFNIYFYKSLVNKTFAGSSGVWTVNSNDNATMVVIKPYYSPSTSYALKVVNFKTSGCGSGGWSKAVSPKLDISNPCCPNDVKFNFTLWTYNVICNDTKAKLEIDFSNNNGVTWTEVWSRTSGQLYSLYGANGKTGINIPVPLAFQNGNFRYRIRGEMEDGDVNNFYVFIDDVFFTSPAQCTPLGSIGDYVWKDLNKNGKQDANEPGIANVTVKLTLPNSTSVTKTTDANGKYLFTNLPAGNYTVTFTTPDGFEPTLANVPSDDAIDSDPVNGSVAVSLGAGQNNLTIDAGYKVKTCTNTVNHTETFPYKFNTCIATSLCNKTFTGSSGTWTVNSNSRAAMAVLTPYYSPSSSYALKVVNFNTNGCSSGWTKAVSPKVDLSAPCCPSEVKMTFTLWTYKMAKNDSKAKLEIDFSANNGSTWTEVWSKSSGQLYTSYGCNGKTMITISVPLAYQNANFRYRIRGEMESGDCNNFYVFIDDIKIGSPAVCTSGTTARTTDKTLVTEEIITTETETEKSIAPVVETIETKQQFAVNVFPNPSNNEFELQLTSPEKVAASIKVLDVLGRVVKTIKVSSNQSIRFGSEFKAGNYIVEIQQGERKETLKLIKL